MYCIGKILALPEQLSFPRIERVGLIPVILLDGVNEVSSNRKTAIPASLLLPILFGLRCLVHPTVRVTIWNKGNKNVNAASMKTFLLIDNEKVDRETLLFQRLYG